MSSLASAFLIPSCRAEKSDGSSTSAAAEEESSFSRSALLFFLRREGELLKCLWAIGAFGAADWDWDRELARML